MDRRDFLKAGVAGGAAQYLVSEQVALAEEKTKETTTDSTTEATSYTTSRAKTRRSANWIEISTGGTANEIAVRQRVITVLQTTYPSYSGLNDTILTNRLNATFDNNEPKFIMWGLFKNSNYNPNQLLALMGIRWNYETLNNGAKLRVRPRLKVIALDENNLPEYGGGKKNRLYRRYLDFIARQIFQNLCDVLPDTTVGLAIHPGIDTAPSAQHVKRLSDHARLRLTEDLNIPINERPKVREFVATDNTRYWKIEIPPQ